MISSGQHIYTYTFVCIYTYISEKAMAPYSSTLAWKIPWTEEPGRLQSTGSRRVRHDCVTSLSLFTFMHWRRKWQPTPVFLPGESQGQGSPVGCHLWGRTESDTTEATQQQQQHSLSDLLDKICLSAPDLVLIHDEIKESKESHRGCISITFKTLDFVSLCKFPRKCNWRCVLWTKESKCKSSMS